MTASDERPHATPGEQPPMSVQEVTPEGAGPPGSISSEASTPGPRAQAPGPTRMSVPALLSKTLRLAVPLYLSTLILGLVPTAVIMLGLGTLAGDRPWRGDLLGPDWLALASEIVMEALYGKGLPGLALVVVGG